MYLSILPTQALRPYVHGYWFVHDWDGAYVGRPINTAPHPGAVLSVNFGRPNEMDGRQIIPKAALLGIQTVARRWRAFPETYFVMAMLSVRGLVRLFPATGKGTTDRLSDLSDLIGDGSAHSLRLDLTSAWEPERICRQLDRWLLRRLETTKLPLELPRLVEAYRSLRIGKSVDKTASLIGLSRRQMNRWFHLHLCISPNQLRDLDRLDASVRAVQQGKGDPLALYSDQSHQIRNWRKRLALTPGSYRQESPSEMALLFGSSKPDAPSFYL
jgi:AraC-like DNA-binding protein